MYTTDFAHWSSFQVFDQWKCTVVALNIIYNIWYQDNKITSQLGPHVPMPGTALKTSYIFIITEHIANVGYQVYE